MFEKLGNHVVGLKDLTAFEPQDFANIVWAYATLNERHPAMFEKVGKRIFDLNNLAAFEPRHLANIVWAYGTLNERHKAMFEKVGKHIVDSNILAAFKPQELANIAWAYTVANADAPMMFNDDFSNALLEMQDEIRIEGRSQLYQWHLWQTKELAHTGLPEDLIERCRQAFVGQGSTVSAFQGDVVNALKSMDLKPDQEFFAPSGYSIDALVKVNGRLIGIEVDGPSHFVDKKPTPRTLLKRRQITAIDKITLVSVPYWTWDGLGKDRLKKQQYLRSLIGASRVFQSSMPGVDDRVKGGKEKEKAHDKTNAVSKSCGLFSCTFH
jgi:hypothetical protein